VAPPMADRAAGPLPTPKESVHTPGTNSAALRSARRRSAGRNGDNSRDDAADWHNLGHKPGLARLTWGCQYPGEWRLHAAGKGTRRVAAYFASRQPRTVSRSARDEQGF